MTKYLYYEEADKTEVVILFPMSIKHKDMWDKLGNPLVHSAGHVRLRPSEGKPEALEGSESLGIGEAGHHEYVSKYLNSSFMFGGA